MLKQAISYYDFKRSDTNGFKFAIFLECFSTLFSSKTKKYKFVHLNSKILCLLLTDAGQYFSDLKSISLFTFIYNN